jgi:hypothetical protein
MAVITSYSTLLTEAASWLARSDLTAAIPGFVQTFEEKFLGDPENHAIWMESALSVTLSNNVAALPTDYLGLRVAYFAGYPPLDRVTLEQLYKRYPRGGGSAGVSRFVARNASNFEFGPETASGTLKGTYYAKPALLRNYTTGGADAVAHFLVVNYPQMLLWGTLLAAEPFIKNDPRVMMWKGALDMEIESYRLRFTAEMYSGSTPFTVAV